MTIGTTNISISAINTENTDTTSNSLKTLSETAIEGLSTLNEAPYAMSEFANYSHVFNTTYSLYTTNSGGKANIDRNHMTLGTTSWPIGADGSDWTVGISSAPGGTTGMILRLSRSGAHTFSGGSTYPNSWVSISATGTNSWTLARSTFSITLNSYNSTTNITSVYFTNYTSTTYLSSSGSGTVYLNV